MTKLIFAVAVFAMTAATAHAMRWDGFRPSTNIEDRRDRHTAVPVIDNWRLAMENTRFGHTVAPEWDKWRNPDKLVDSVTSWSKKFATAPAS